MEENTIKVLPLFYVAMYNFLFVSVCYKSSQEKYKKWNSIQNVNIKKAVVNLTSN